MSLSKQLYAIISFIFLMIFAGNFIISVQNTKDYLEIESQTKAQDTATSIGMTLRSLINDKNDPEIETIIKAIANRGFYKEIRLEDIEMSFSTDELIREAKDLDESTDWVISEVSVDPKFGLIEKNNSDDEVGTALNALEEGKSIESENLIISDNRYKFIPADDFVDGNSIDIHFIATYKNESLKSKAILKVDKVLVKESRKEKFDYIPQWFIDMFPLVLDEKKSEISDGWKVTSVIYVSANAGDAYAKLYEQAKSAIIYAAVAFIIAIILLVVFLQFILQPLKRIEKLAMNIARGEFSVIKKLPYTTEIKNVAIAMNDMSLKIEGIIKKLNKNIDNMSQKISTDDLTGLSLKQTFETDIKKMFITKSCGYVLNIKIDKLGDYAKNHDNAKVDNFIKSFALILKDCNREFKYEISAYRFFGSEFAMIVQNCNSEEIAKVTSYLKEKFEAFGLEVEKKEIAHIGATPFNPFGTINEMLVAANESCETAKQIGPNEACIRDENDLARDMTAWKELIFDIIDNFKFSVGYINDAKILNEPNEGKLVLQEAFTSASDTNDEQIPIGTFVSIAEKYDKILDFDKAVIQKVINYIQTQNITHDISINLSIDSIENSSFTTWLKDTLLNHRSIANQLVFSMTSYGVAKDINNFKSFAKLVHENGGKIIIKRFESKFIPLDNIKELNIDYIRLAREYTNGICKDSGKEGFVESMQELSTLLNIKILAENVREEDDFKKIKRINIFAASR